MTRGTIVGIVFVLIAVGVVFGCWLLPDSIVYIHKCDSVLVPVWNILAYISCTFIIFFTGIGIGFLAHRLRKWIDNE